MKILCKLFGHKWIKGKLKINKKWHEFERCRRCFEIVWVFSNNVIYKEDIIVEDIVYEKDVIVE